MGNDEPHNNVVTTVGKNELKTSSKLIAKTNKSNTCSALKNLLNHYNLNKKYNYIKSEENLNTLVENLYSTVSVEKFVACKLSSLSLPDSNVIDEKPANSIENDDTLFNTMLLRKSELRLSNEKMLNTKSKTSIKSEKSSRNNCKLQNDFNDLCFYVRYKECRAKALTACRKNKIFILAGPHTIRTSLRKRGWVEKLCTNYLKNIQIMPLKKILKYSKPGNKYEKVAISKLLHSFQPTFIWARRFKSKMKNRFFHFPYRSQINRNSKLNFTSKIGLIQCIENSYWHSIAGVSEVKTPRYYRLFDGDDKIDFLNDYKTTYCISLLLFVTEEPNNVIFSEFGSVPISVLKFALNRVKSEINHRMHFDIDAPDSNLDQTFQASKEEWQRFYLDCDLIQNAVMRFDISGGIDYKRFIKDCKECINEAKAFWPTLETDGFNNIWILKPANCCRGHGILIRKSITDIIDWVNKNNSRKYIVQKYIERPLLIYNTKFDIRQYFLVTISDDYVSIWMYKDCYLKFSSQEYDLQNFKESIHITNNAVQKKYRNAVVRSKKLPQHNMWHLNQFTNYLKENDVDETIWVKNVYPAMRRNIIAIVSTSLDETEFIPNSFEIYGCDFILDRDYEPFLLEINATPDMSPSTKVTAKLCPQVLEDLIKVVIDHQDNPESKTGDFELIFRTQIPKVPLPISLSVIGKSKPIIKMAQESITALSKQQGDVGNYNNGNKNNKNFKNLSKSKKTKKPAKSIGNLVNNIDFTTKLKDNSGEILIQNRDRNILTKIKQTNKQKISKRENSSEFAPINAKEGISCLKKTVARIKNVRFNCYDNDDNNTNENYGNSTTKKYLTSNEKVALTLKSTTPSSVVQKFPVHIKS